MSKSRRLCNKNKKKELYASLFDINKDKLDFALYIIDNIFFAKMLFNNMLAFVNKRLA